MTRRREIHEIEFTPDAVSGVLAHMDHLSLARDGWLNLVPGAPEEEVEAPTVSAFSALFGTAQVPLAMCTWLPGRPDRHGGEETVGIMHPKGRGAVAQLREAGIPLPEGWRVRQDHVRRGVIAVPGPHTTHAEVLSWLLRAGASLSLVPLTGKWQARVYLPR